MMNQYMRELEQDPFDPDEFVERMVRRSMQESRLEDDQFDPEMIHDIFTQAIQDLKVLQERQERKCTRLEQAVQEEEKLYGAKLSEIMDQHLHCVGVFSSLDERMSRCGGRALNVGEKLGAARAPRARAAAARDLLSHLTHFLSPGPVIVDLFSDPNKVGGRAHEHTPDVKWLLEPIDIHNINVPRTLRNKSQYSYNGCPTLQTESH